MASCRRSDVEPISNVQLLFTSSQPILDSTSNTRKEETFLRKPSSFHFQQSCGINTLELIGYLMLWLPRVGMHPGAMGLLRAHRILKIMFWQEGNACTQDKMQKVFIM